MTEKKAEVQISLTDDEALVLFEFLSRYADKDELYIVDQAEQRALWKLCCFFESSLATPFNKNYGEALEDARARLRGEVWDKE